MRKVFWGLAIFSGILSVFVAFFMFTQANIDKRRPVVSFDRVETMNSPIRAGEALKVRIWREKVRDDCPVTSTRMALDHDGKIYDLPNLTWKGGPPRTKYLEYEYETLPDMPVGHYQLRVDLEYQCPKVKEPFRYAQPTALFTIEK